MKYFLTALMLTLVWATIYAQSDGGSVVGIHNFIIRPSVPHYDKIEVVTCDAHENAMDQLCGTFIFNVNGFRQELTVKNGVAVFPQRIDQSTFIYARHENENGIQGKLYYLFKGADSIRPIKVNSWILIVIPLLLVGIASIFRKFIVIAVVLIISLFVFNTTNGLNMPTLLSTFFDGLKNLL